jgi:integrase
VESSNEIGRRTGCFLTIGPFGSKLYMQGEGTGFIEGEDQAHLIAGRNAPNESVQRSSFSNQFVYACRAAGVPGSAHGVRKIAATRAANAGATVAQLEAIFGWKGGRMAALYTQSADRKRLALEAMHKLSGNSIPAPKGKVRAPAEKSK